jgi:hypothetical protein
MFTLTGVVTEGQQTSDNFHKPMLRHKNRGAVTEGQRTSDNFHRPLLHHHCTSEESINTVK